MVALHKVKIIIFLVRIYSVECGINRVFVRSTTKAGKIILTAKAKGSPDASVLLETIPVTIKDGLGTYLPQYTLKGRFDKGETPRTPIL